MRKVINTPARGSKPPYIPGSWYQRDKTRATLADESQQGSTLHSPPLQGSEREGDCVRFANHIGETTPYSFVYQSLAPVVKYFHWTKKLKTINKSSVTKLSSHLFGIRQPEGRVRSSVYFG